MLRIRSAVVEGIMAHVKREAPLEACGYLAERDGIVIGHYELTNVKASEVRYAMDPAEQFAAVRRMRADGLRLRAAYHSHPTTPARPSAEDMRLAYDRGLSYVIVSLIDFSMRSFQMREGAFEQEEIEIIGGALCADPSGMPDDRC